MAKRSEYQEIQRIARSRQMSVAEWVRQVLAQVRREQPVSDVAKKLENIRAAARHEYPVGDIEDMLAEIEGGHEAAP